jgi:hypothetical protein
MRLLFSTFDLVIRKLIAPVDRPVDLPDGRIDVALNQRFLLSGGGRRRPAASWRGLLPGIGSDTPREEPLYHRDAKCQAGGREKEAGKGKSARCAAWARRGLAGDGTYRVGAFGKFGKGNNPFLLMLPHNGGPLTGLAAGGGIRPGIYAGFGEGETSSLPFSMLRNHRGPLTGLLDPGASARGTFAARSPVNGAGRCWGKGKWRALCHGNPA